MKIFKGMILFMVTLTTALLFAPVAQAQDVDPIGDEYSSHRQAVGGRMPTEEEMEELRVYTPEREVEFRKEIVLDMFNTVWRRTGTVQRMHAAMSKIKYNPDWPLEIFYTYTPWEEVEESLPKKIWGDARYLLQNGWGFWENFQKTPWAISAYGLDENDLFMAVFQETGMMDVYGEAYTFGWDVYTFADGREAHVFFNYCSVIHFLNTKKGKVATANEERTLLGKLKNGKLELYDDVHDDIPHFNGYDAYWLDLGNGWYYTLVYGYYSNWNVIIVDPPLKVLEDVVDQGAIAEEIG